MKIVKTRWFPLWKFTTINLFGILFTKTEPSKKTINHESIHTAQMKEMLYIGFYLWYVFEWTYQAIVRIYNKNMKAYYFITMEQEAYDNEYDLGYLSTRKKYAWLKYVGKWVKY